MVPSSKAAQDASGSPASASLRLVLLRHAKSAWDNPDLSDHDRPLAPRGARAAKQMGAFISQSGLQPQLILCSSAQRALDTLELAEAAWPRRSEVQIDRSIYLCGVDDLRERIAETGGTARSLMVIGHNPDMEELASSLLTGTARQDEAAKALLSKYPTTGLAVFDLPIATWVELCPETTGKLVLFQTPRQLQAA